MDPGSANQLNGYDKLYLLMLKWKVIRLFNPLCYATNIRCVEDLETQVTTNLDALKRKLPNWAQTPSFSDDLETIQKMIDDSKTVKYEDLPSLLDIKKNNYKEELEAAGVQMIEKEQVSLQTKIALGRPYSGDVYNAQWTQGHNKIDVVLRYDLGPAQRELFIREAKIMARLHHEYIMKFYGAVILGSYADSVGLVVELFSKGNLEEFRVPSLFHAWLYASQLSSALEYLQSKHLVHTSIVEPFVYISSLEKISIGGFMCCYYEEEIDKTRQSGYQGDLLWSTITGHQGRRLDDLSLKGVVAMFSHLVTGMFRYLDSHRSSQLLALFPGDKKWPLVCPSGIASLLDRCLDEDVNNRPAFQEIVQVLAKERPAKLCFTMSNSSAEPCELSYEEGEKIWVISQDTDRYHGMWFGQKENGITGFFEHEKTIKTDDDDQVPHEIRARGIEAELAYKVALLEGKVKVCRARLFIIGPDRTGKTSLKKSLIGLPFNPEEPSTEVLEINSSKLEVGVEQEVKWKAINADSEFEQVRPEDLRIARLVAEHMTQKKENKEGQISPKEEKEINYERDVAVPTQMNVIRATDESSAVPSSTQEPSRSQDLVDGFQGNLTPKPNIKMPEELTPLVTECLRNPNTPSGDDVATETVLDIWDFAGQHLYYATHPIFFTHTAIYLLVHNLQKNPNDLAEPSFKHEDRTTQLQNMSNETNLDVLLSWLVSVHSIRGPPTDHEIIQICKSNLHCLPPPVLVVGTHADQVSVHKMEQVESQIASSITGKTYHEHVLQKPFYRVDNTQSSNSSAIKEIQTRVQQILSSGLNSTAELPVKWLNFEKAVKSLADEKCFMTLEEIGRVAQQECFIDDDKQLDAMLNYYHDLGLIVRFKDTVVLNSQRLIDLFKNLITTCPFEEQNPVDRKLWQDLGETGVLHMQLIDKAFEDLHCNGGKSLQQNVLDMMEKYGFLAKFHHRKESGEQPSNSCGSDVKYFVPAQLRVSCPELWELTPKDSDPCSLVFKFCDGFVPHGLFPQLVSRLIALSSKLECTKDLKLYCNGAHFFLGKKSQFDLVLLCSKHCIKLVLKGHDTDSEKMAVNSLAIQVRTLIEQELESLCKQWHWLGNMHYDLCVPCSACLSSSHQCERHKSASCLDQDCMHLLPISSVKVESVTSFTCPEQVGEHSKFTLANLHMWYFSSEEKPPESERTLARIADIDIITLAGKIPTTWKVIGRLLGLGDSRISQIEIDNAGNVYEQCYAMLKAWKDNQPDSSATCQQLKNALSHEIVMKKDLVQDFCYKSLYISSASEKLAMASSAAPAFPSTKETTNYARLCCLLVDVGSQVLRDTFDRIHPPANLHKVLQSFCATLLSLRKKRILNARQWGKLYPAIKSSVSSKDFDITLLMVLLRNICDLDPPTTGWNNLPSPTDVTPEADIARVTCYRKMVYCHASQASVDDANFGTYWSDIRDALVRLGGASYAAAIDVLKHECMDPDVEEHYQELLKQWQTDKENIQDELLSIAIADRRTQRKVSSVEDVQDVESSGVVTSEGGPVSVNGVKLTCPPGAVDDSVTIKLKLEEPHKYCGLIVHHGLENDVIFNTPIINCQPNGQIFKKHVTLAIALDNKKRKASDTLLVLHGTPTADGRIFWEDITHNSKLDLEKEEIKVEITQFSLIAVLLRLTWIHTKGIVTRLNFLSFKYTLSVLFKSNYQNSPYEELAFMFMSQDIYQEQFYREHDDSALVQLKRNGFEEISSNVGQQRNFIYNNETLTVSIQLGEDYKPANNQQECITFSVDSSVWWSTGHVIKLPLQGSSADVKILCGRIAVQGQYGHVREDAFCQLDQCSYVRRLLGVENAIFNLKPVALKLELPEETLNQVVACWQSETKQLEMILLRWREKQGNTDDLAVLRKVLVGLEPEEYRVKERGQMHIEHLRELAVTISGLQHEDPNMMKYLGFEIKKLCNSVLRDCCIEMASTKEDLDSVTSTKNCASLLEIHGHISEDLAKKYKQLCLSPEKSITRNFLMIVAPLVQAIKEIFRDERIPPVQSGLRGVSDETTIQKISSDIQEAAQNKSIFRLLCEVCKILENLCLSNNANRSTEDEIHNWGGSAMVLAMLNFLEKFFQSSEARRLRKRLEVFSVCIRDILSNPSAFEGNFLRDFHNVALSLLEFSKFDPSQLVRFELNDPTNSSNTQGDDGLKCDKSQETFSQLFWIRKESDDELQLEAVAHVHINGHIRSIGAFESLITLPESCGEAIDRVPIASLSVALKRERDDSGNLRVTLYATQKENVRKALNYLENEVGADVVDLKRTDITQSHLKVYSFAKAGTVVRLRLVHKWGSEELVLDSPAGGAFVPDTEIAAEVGQLAIRNELPALPIASDSTVGNYGSNFVIDPSDAELIQRHVHEQRGRVEIHYHQNFLRGHVCVAGQNTNLNMQLPLTGQHLLEAGSSAEPHRSITAGTGADEM